MQEFTELCRKRDTAAAIAYSRKNLAPWASSHMPQLQQAMTMLVFGERTGVNLYKVSTHCSASRRSTALNPAQKLYDPAQWLLVRDAFRETFLSLYALPSQPLLSLAMSAGLASLRLPACTASTFTGPSTPKAVAANVLPRTSSSSGREPRAAVGDLLFPVYTTPAEIIDSLRSQHSPSRNIPIMGAPILASRTPLPAADAAMSSSPPRPDEAQSSLRKRHDTLVGGVFDRESGNVDCPTCGDAMRVLAKEVPMSHHVNSTLVCRISGEVMDSDNAPMAFPNGYVYSSKVGTGPLDREIKASCHEMLTIAFRP